MREHALWALLPATFTAGSSLLIPELSFPGFLGVFVMGYFVAFLVGPGE